MLEQHHVPYQLATSIEKIECTFKKTNTRDKLSFRLDQLVHHHHPHLRILHELAELLSRGLSQLLMSSVDFDLLKTNANHFRVFHYRSIDLPIVLHRSVNHLRHHQHFEPIYYHHYYLHELEI